MVSPKLSPIEQSNCKTGFTKLWNILTLLTHGETQKNKFAHVPFWDLIYINLALYWLKNDYINKSWC